MRGKEAIEDVSRRLGRGEIVDMDLPEYRRYRPQLVRDSAAVGASSYVCVKQDMLPVVDSTEQVGTDRLGQRAAHSALTPLSSSTRRSARKA